METGSASATITTVPCSWRQVVWSQPMWACPTCGVDAPRVWEVTRLAIDIDLEQPVVLAVEVSVHACRACQRHFRAQPPFLRPGAIYTRRVVQKAVASFQEDAMAARRIPDRLARDFCVRPSEKMVRRWVQEAAAHLDFAADYQPWVVASFSGILCVDEVYRGDVALLLAVDPAAPEGDRLVGYTLLTTGVDQAAVQGFLVRLKQAGIEPEEVITDGSALYPSVLAAVWPAAAHQLCLFHETRRVVEAVNDVLKAVRRTLPAAPSAAPPTLNGHARATPPAEDQHDPAAERWRWRQAATVAGATQAHQLRHQGQSERAIQRQLGFNRRTIRRWLRQPPPMLGGPIPDALPPAPPPPVELPPPGWRDWDEARQVREHLRRHRTLLLRHPTHLTPEEQATLADLLSSPVGERLRVARRFLEEWFALFHDERGQRRSPVEAEDRYLRWRTNSAAADVAPLRKVQRAVDPERFARLSAFLRHPRWEATNNAAERGGRAFRHSQHSHFQFRTAQAIAADLTARACQHKARVEHPAPRRLHLCQRGRRPPTAVPALPLAA